MKYLLTCLGLIILGLTIYLWVSLNNLNGTSNTDSISIYEQSRCDLSKSKCKLDLNSDIGVIQILPVPFYLNEKITVMATFKEKGKRSIQLDLKGLDMDMGFNRFKMMSDDSLNYKVTFNLPTCTKSYMAWMLGVYKDKKSLNTYKFLAQKRDL